MLVRRMEFSLDDLLDEVEGAMMGDSARPPGCGPQTNNATERSHPPLASKTPPDPLGLSNPSAWVAGCAPTGGGGSVRAASYGATPLQLAGLTLPVGGTNADSESRIPGDFLNDVDELLRVVSGVQADSGRGLSKGRQEIYQPQGGAAVAGVVAMVARDNPLTPDAAVSEKTNGSGLATAGKKRRCGTVCLAGTATRRGFCASSISQCACDRLRCTECNFKVMCFDGRAWDAEIDYMFLRNNSPDASKLSARLQFSADTCAYACQCSWENVEDLRTLSPTERPRWACGGH